MNDFHLRSARYLAEQLCLHVLRPGDSAVDATMGNGHDTLRLCRLVGDEGKVYAFDLQIAALDNTRERLRLNGMEDRAQLYHMGHEHMLDVVPPPVRLVLFNLGWLPGGDKGVTTRTETTINALQEALSLLQTGGMVSVCAYPGHEEGVREQSAVLHFAQSLPSSQFTVLWHQFINGGTGAPACLMIEKIGCQGK